MPNLNYIKGRGFEYRVKSKLERKGFSVYRLAGSKPFDLIAIGFGGVYAVECKKKDLTSRELNKIIGELWTKIKPPLRPLVAYKNKGQIIFYPL